MNLLNFFGFFFLVIAFSGLFVSWVTVGTPSECERDYQPYTYYIRKCLEMRLLFMVLPLSLIGLGILLNYFGWKEERPKEEIAI